MTRRTALALAAIAPAALPASLAESPPVAELVFELSTGGRVRVPALSTEDKCYLAVLQQSFVALEAHLIADGRILSSIYFYQPFAYAIGGIVQVRLP